MVEENSTNKDASAADSESLFDDIATVRAFRSLAEAGEGDLAGQLEDVGVLVEKSESEDAAVLFEVLLDEIGNKRRSAPIRSLWSSLIELTPKAIDHVYDGSALEELLKS